MKTYLFTLCLAFPFLLNAQNVVKKTTNELQLFSNLENQQVMLNSGASQLPDSIYTYTGRDYEYLDRKAAFTYDTEGRVMLEKGEKHMYEYGNARTAYKKEYTYTIESDSFEEEVIIESHLINGQWQEKYKYTTYSHSNNPTSTQMIVETKKYYIDTIAIDKWKLEQKKITTEFDEKGYPVAMVDSSWVYSWDKTYLYLDKYEISYNENNQIDSMKRYNLGDIADKRIWKSKYTYDDDGRLTKIHSLCTQKYIYENNEITGEWYIITDYKYDEKGNLVYKSVLNDDTRREELYKNFYSSSVSNQVLEPAKLSDIYIDPAGNITVSINAPENATVYISNIAGQLIWTQNVSSQRTTIPAGNLSKGICIVRVQTAKGSDTYKILVK